MLVVEDGSGVAGAESYVAVADADAYFAKRGSPASWTGLSESVKEQYLREGTDYLEMMYDGRWKGCKVESDQALSWPRYNVHDSDGIVLDSAIIPQKLKNALCEAALQRTSGDLLPVLNTPGDIKETDVQAGPVRSRKVYAGTASQLASYSKVVQWLRTLIQDVNTLERA